MEGVVLVERTTDWTASASQAHLVAPWEPAAGIQEEKKKWLLNHYHLWNHSETAGNVQTDKPGNIVKSGT